MSNEIQVPYNVTAKTLYAIIRNAVGQVWRTDTHVFESYTTANLANYTIALTEQGTASGFYVGTFSSLISAGIYNITAFVRAGGSAAESDLIAGSESNFYWNGLDTTVLPSIRKNTPLSAFEFVLYDSINHVIPVTGRTVTAQRSIDGAALTSCTNSVTEVSNGIYKINLSAADLNGNVITLRFSATGADDELITIVTQP